MPDRFEPEYAYARVCGSLARSFIGERAASLAKSARVGEAWRSVFGEPPPALPEAELASEAERGLRARPTLALRAIAGPLADEEPFFAALSRKWEFACVKSLLAAAALGQSDPPLADPGLAPAFDAAAYPELGAMFGRSRYAWVVETGLEDLPAVKNALDRQYYSELWEALRMAPRYLKASLPGLVKVEAELVNLAWALRLKRYYSLGPEAIKGLLIELPGIDLAGAAMDALSRKPDSRADWAGWRWERLLPEARREDGSDWYFDIRLFESASRRYLFRLLYRRLHLEFESYVPLYSYFRIKECETLAIHGIIEGIKLEASSSEIAAFALDATGGAA